MSHYVYVDGDPAQTKKAIKEAVKDGPPENVYVQDQGLFGGFSGELPQMPVGQKVYFEGPPAPKPHRFYGSIERINEQTWKVE